MVENEKSFLFQKVVNDNGSTGELKTQFTIQLSDYDTSQMPNYKVGQKVYTGFTCALKTLKPSKTYPRSQINIDPSNKEIRQAIFDMYEAYDALDKK